jgi:hypothetical protein
MKITRFGAIRVAALIGAIAATACSSSKSKDSGVHDGGPGADGGDGGPTGAGIVADEASLDFGAANVGTAGMRHTLTIRNAGGTTTGVLSSMLMGMDRASFAETMDGCSGQPLAPGGTCAVEIEFLPATLGALNAELVIAASPGGTATVMLSGTGNGPARLVVTPAMHDFGPTPLGIAVVQHFIVANTGLLSTGEITAALQGMNATEFQIRSDGCSHMTLGPATSCAIDIALSPLTTGVKTATLTVDAMPGGPVHVVLLGGGTPGARIVAIPMGFNFGDAVVGSIGNAQRFFIQNAATATSGAVAFSAVTGANASDFVLSGDTCAGHALGPMAVCTATITFVPGALGLRSAMVQVSATPGGMLSLPLMGTGVSTMPLMIQPTSRNYGATPNMTTGLPVPFQITNPNPSPSSVLTATITGPNASEFSINGDACTGHRVHRFTSCTVGVSFDPLTIGDKSATLMVTGSGGEQLTAALSGISIPPPALGFTVTAYSFGTQDVHSMTTYRFFLRNNGALTSGPIAVTTMGSGDFTITADACNGMTLAPTAMCSVDVTFTPSGNGPRNATILAAGTPGGTASAAVDGNGTDQFLLSITEAGGGSGTVSGGGLMCPPTCNARYMDGTSVTLTAAPDAVSTFVGWSGACSGTGSCTLTLHQSENVTATFALRNFALNVTVDNLGNAHGTVTSAPSGISCAPSCNASYVARTPVVLTASSARGFAFQGWSGDCTGIQPTCALTLVQDANVTATFTPFNIAFVTEATFTPGALGGAGGADAACARAASNANLAGNYRAWISTSTQSALQRLFTLAPQPRGWVRPDGLPFVDSLLLLQAGEVLWPLRVNERGVSYATETDVLTGTNGDGSSVASLLCGDWRSTSGAFIFGDATAGTESWTSFGSGLCNAPGYHLYCFGTSYQAPIRITPAPGRFAFLSEGNIAPSSGIAGADALCTQEATAAGLPGSYRAFLATSSVSALSRFDLTGPPWVRVDGIPVVASAADLATRPLTSISVRATGTYLGRGFVWTGISTDPSSPSTAALTCRDWSSVSVQDMATVGYETATDPGAWDAFGQEPCNYPYGHLYCFQE